MVFKAESPEPEPTDPKVIKSPFPDVEMITGLTVSEYVRKESLDYQESNITAFECLVSGTKYTFKDVFDLSHGFAAGLLKLGLCRREVVAVVLPNIPEYASVLFGIWDAGGICSPVNPAYGKDELKWQLTNSEAKYVVTLPPYIALLRELKTEFLPTLKIIVIGETDETDCISFFELAKTDTADVHFLTGSEIDTATEVAMLPYSSGTTGLPKGVMLTHANICTNILQVTRPGVLIMEKTIVGSAGPPPERFIALLPMFHIFGLVMSMTGICFGVHNVTISKFDPMTFVNTIRAHKPTVLHVVTPLVALMVNSPLITAEHFASLKAIVAGAAPVGPTLINAFIQKANKPITYQEGYGMTELSPCTHVLNPLVGKHGNKIGSIGCPVPSTCCKVISTDGLGHSLGPNEIGELCVKGPQVMKGYLKNDEATHNTIDADGWLHTGDIGYYDRDNYFYIVDRLKELIKVKGEQVAPAELENTLRGHPLVMDAAVIGIPHAEVGELPRAYIVRKSNDLTEEEIQEFVRSKLARFKQLKGGVQFVESIPKAPSGKILRRVLRQEYANQMLLAKELQDKHL